MSRLVIVSNRLPVTVRQDSAGLRLDASTGGLATGLRRLHARRGGTWIGWPGTTLAEPLRDEVDTALARFGARAVWLDEREIQQFYDGFSNGVLWSLFHDQPNHIPTTCIDADTWMRVNGSFARAAAAALREGDLVWVHDYQLAATPALLRGMAPEAQIGFFLHIPFPAPEVLRALPWRRAVLEGMLGANLVGFHAAASAYHFLESCVVHLGARVREDRVLHGGRATRVAVFPMGIDARAWSQMAARPEVLRAAHALQRPGESMLLGVDRLDLTKGIPRRLLAFERMLERSPDWVGRVRLVQIGVPSREALPPYRALRQTVEQLAGRINGAWSTGRWSPVQLILRPLEEAVVAAHYRAADVMLVTPLRDGMNLVAKEFCAARNDEDGVLVLSELAGAAHELDAALPVNPYDIDGVAAALHRALRMPLRERRARMERLRRTVAARDVHAWGESFLSALAETRSTPPTSRADTLACILRHLAPSERLVLLLDWDGTLTRIVANPDDAAPDAGARALLRRLARTADVHLVSGRRRDQLEAWFGDLPLHLHAEHGIAWRRPGETQWATLPVDVAWLEEARRVLEAFCQDHPGTRLEAKPAGFALHWRSAPEHAAAARDTLRALAAAHPSTDLLEGLCVIELRPRGTSKARVLERLLLRPLDGVLALGDDTTDSELFAALPEQAWCVQVGPGPRFSGLSVAGPDEARSLLARLADARARRMRATSPA